ncbi:MAG: penicillin-binding transpeptidase domain-containing protein [Enterocloster bolteae]
MTAVAALEEGVIGLQDTIECTGIYDQISKPIKCWIWPGRHNSENIEEAYRNPATTSSPSWPTGSDEAGRHLFAGPGLATLRKYATLFGLDHTSGVEISENEPQISSEDPERSAMGQGTHSYTNVQLSRYVAALANRGNVFELSLLDKLTDSDGNLIKDYTPAISPMWMRLTAPGTRSRPVCAG